MMSAMRHAQMDETSGSSNAMMEILDQVTAALSILVTKSEDSYVRKETGGSLTNVMRSVEMASTSSSLTAMTVTLLMEMDVTRIAKWRLVGDVVMGIHTRLMNVGNIHHLSQISTSPRTTPDYGSSLTQVSSSDLISIWGIGTSTLRVLDPDIH